MVRLHPGPQKINTLFAKMTEGAPKREINPSREQIEDLRLWTENQPNNIRGNKNELAALAMNIKPAVILDTKINAQQEQELLDNLATMGADSEVYRNCVVINSEALGQRLQDEPELAKFVGWDTNLSIHQNLDPAFTADDNVFTVDDGMVGFILGFPKSAIETFLKVKELKKRGLPLPTAIISGNPPANWDNLDREEITKINDGLSQLYATSSTRSKEETKTAARHIIQENEGLLRKIYLKYLNATDDETDFLFSIQQRTITDSSGEKFFQFGVAGEEGASAPDVLALEAKVRNALDNLK